MSFSRRVIKQCYAMQGSSRYTNVKQAVYNLLENPQAPIRPYFDIFMILLVLTTVWLLIYEVKNDLGVVGDLVEMVAVGIFIIEYLLRFWIFNDSHKVILERYERAEFINESFDLWPALWHALLGKLKYVIRPLAIIDLLAIIPSYRPLRFLRIFLLFRLFKLFRYTRSISEFVKVLSEKRIELVTLFIFMAFITFTAATAIFFFEADQQDSQITGFFDSVYWALVTMSTVGYGDITPNTTEGRVITLVLIIAGLGVISFFTSIIVSAFGEKIHEIRAHRIYSEIERKRIDTLICGYGRVGQVVAERMAVDRRSFVVVDPVEENVRVAKKKQGHLAVVGDGEDTELLLSLGIDKRIQRLLCLTGDDVVNVYITLTARQVNPDIEIISRANHRENVSKLYRAGASYCVTPYEVFGLIAAEYAGQPVAFEAVYGLLTGQSHEGIEAVRIKGESVLVGRSLESIDFTRRKLTPFGVIREKDSEAKVEHANYDLQGRRFFFNPGKSFILEKDDLLVLLGHEYSVVHFRDCLERGTL
ncbi:MAG: potassium channel protein [gamma proteobacterium symbiont of Ctena orbiculata]|uniref:BK channel n=1 Tax=Candidatus Thiodiazotropha taylori TaxID=2792791 RepID=A0A944M676_9GAMM|nr:NAD-binding protein [Candidatus Thiodiazotropha taylori]PUB86590.1 MAG: potassium channel protein [gamma proteobacterium symbiont of Ctena orbiculata]MBT2987910.1 NAD-binding protein [Candidatus Thiodiazotropha taylori]MBT2997555.1 NAD-binding protein [Candidatus Thiodiazotropha taylori]MBT2999019.1 NAD-binding protein [Candidatus Thiodiazotropha taylori]